MLKSKTSPPISFFKTLPTQCKKLWAVYLLVLQKPDGRTNIYIGTGTSFRYGVADRLTQYNNPATQPRFVKKALEDGYNIVHKGLLCWTTIPSAAQVPVVRVLFLALEALFTFTFWSLYTKKENGYEMGHMCPWPRDSLEYDGLSSHNPLIEGPCGNHTLSPEELEAAAVEAERIHKEKERDRKAKAKEANPEKFRADANKRTSKWRKVNPDKAKAKDQRQDAKKIQGLKEKKHYCGLCDRAFRNNRDLKRHVAGIRHAAKAKVKASGEKSEHHCATCDLSFTRKGSLADHLTSKWHLSKVASLEGIAIELNGNEKSQS